MVYKYLAKPFLFRMDAEKAHHLTIHGLRKASRIPGMLSLMRTCYQPPQRQALKLDRYGLHFTSPIGLAAGLDKNGEAAEAFSVLGFGFIEVGTVTPLAQPGNAQPRLFRLPSDAALINRMGFNNHGAEAMAASLSAMKHRPIPIAINIGKNKATPNEEAARDYRTCIQHLYAHGDLFVVNISSPNTPNLRQLQHGDELKNLLAAVKDEMTIQHQHVGGAEKPVFVKVAPDVNDEQLDYMIETIVESGVAGVIATNTTLERPGLTGAHRFETGGLSGKPLAEKSTALIRAIYQKTDGQLPIIGSGGIFDAQDAYDKIRAGAMMVEVYTALIYKGPGLIRELTKGLLTLLHKDGFTHIQEAIGSGARQ